MDTTYSNNTFSPLASSLFDTESSIKTFFRHVAHHPYPQADPRIPLSKSLFEFTIRPEFPISLVIGYVVMIGWLNYHQDGRDRMKGDRWKAVLVLHNVLLAVYSFWTFKGSALPTFAYFLEGYRQAGLSGLVHTFCDSSMNLWDHSMGFYGYWFYLSKFWEILDSLILIGKGRQASLLQEYHHAGAILTVWSGVRYESPAAWLFIVFNSLVHTIMYSYYAISVLHLPFPAVLKRSLTKIQIAQFILGGSLGALNLILQLPKVSNLKWNPIQTPEGIQRLGTGFVERSCLHTPGQKLTVLGGVGYLIPLTGLFVSFYIRAYQRQRNRKVSNSTGSKLNKSVKLD